MEIHYVACLGVSVSYQLKAKASDFVKNVSEGTVYCAKFSVDGNWYRVMVKKILQTKGKVGVVDWGGSRWESCTGGVKLAVLGSWEGGG